MIIAATSDIHSPRNYELFVRSLDNLTDKIDLFLLAGDIVDQGNVEEYQKIINALFGRINCPKVACFGNSEFGREQTEKIIQRYSNEITFLDDESIVLDVKNSKVCIVGSKGSLDRPTYWQYKNIPGVEEEYRNRVRIIREKLFSTQAEFKILLTHYAPTYKILEGENINAYPELGSQLMENVILEVKPNLVVCGHAHKGKKMTRIDGVPIFNVGLSLNGKIVVIDTERDLKFGLEKYI
ncbi:MAG: metallophosphoesterase [Candidatus Aenigmatarchaeota archaeon]|nr:metallophosphoesterase [Candidatus Aenigmarchaeota archaeon]